MFKEILENVVTSCSGGVGAVLMGYDGIAIDHYSVEENSLDLNLVGIEYSNVTKEIRNAADILSVGALQEVSIKTEHYYVIIHSLTDEYFIALMIERTGNYGQGRYLLMRDAPALRQALA
ncbi:MAG: roadblock/LC7 domain-containing protein [Desulfuromusa sp.]|nr:roadblock/LC7 domain-containing protein [Desulfuromusa sp.]